MQAACHETSGTIIADYNLDHGGSSGQAERLKSLGLFIHLHEKRATHMASDACSSMVLPILLYSVFPCYAGKTECH
jgi:hypothetical protein